jgi:hypothetical protein
VNTNNTTIEERDHMPHQVATELLTTPKTKLTNRMRKNCLDARSTHHASNTPLRAEGKKRTPERRYVATSAVKKPAEDKIRARMKAATSPQLEKWLKRCVARRVGVQEKYNNALGKQGPKWNYIRALLEATAQRIDTMRDIIEDVLQDRFARHQDSVLRHVHPRRFRAYGNKHLSQAA